MARRRLGLAASLVVVMCSAGAAAEHSAQSGAYAFHTFLSWDAANGPQIEYLDGAGGAYLWYPGVAETIAGRWLLRAEDQICFVYPGFRSERSNLPDFAREICMSVDEFFKTTLSKRAGDVFDLAAGAPPFILERADFFVDFESVRR